MAGPVTNFTVPEESYEGLGILADLGRERVTELIEELSAQPLTLDFDSVAARLADVLGPGMEAVLSSALVPLNQICNRSGLSSEEFVSALDVSVREQASPSWLNRYASPWSEVAAHLEPLFAPGQFLRAASKAIELLYERSALLLDFRMLTELRPLYDEEAAKIEALILTNTLVIEYQQGKTEHSLHLSVDYDDLYLMREQLDRVLKKNDLASAQAKEWKLDVLTTDGE
jgi:hypothetical protein